MRTFRSVVSCDRQSPFATAIGVISLALTGLIYYAPAQAQQSADDEVLEEIVVQGSRATIQSTINIRRNSTTIVDGLSAVDIGDLPALSIGEALESMRA